MSPPILLTAATAVNAMGAGLEKTLRALREETSGLRHNDFEAPGQRLDSFIGRVAGVEDAAITGDLAKFDCRNNRLAQMALASDGFTAAVEGAVARYGADRIAVIMGSSTSGVGECETAYQTWAKGEVVGGAKSGTALPAGFHFNESHDFYSLPRYLSARLGIEGPSTTVSAACASSSKVFADAWQWLEAGVCDAALVGGVDSLCRMTLRGFNSLELLSKDPCRPNDVARAGLSIGEAAGFALLERLETPEDNAVALLGYGESSDAYHMSSPHPEGKGATLAMKAALVRAGLAPDDIDYINLHGTGSHVNDRVEDTAVVRIFGRDVPTSSTKGWSGHCLGASGITEALIAYLCLREGFIPANLNLQSLDPDIRSNVQRRSVETPLKRVLSNSFGFGGCNCSLILGRPD